MFSKQIDFMAIGDITTDAFIRLKNADVHCEVNAGDCEICLPFGDKIPFEYVKVVKAVGNSANAAVAAARLGLRTAFITNIGDDQNGRDCKVELEKNKVITSYVKVNDHKPTNYHFVLWYAVDRTILVNHTEYNYRLPNFPEPKWIYLSSLASNTHMYHIELADYLETHPKVRLAFQPGTFQMNLGVRELKRIYDRTEVFIVNVEEAQRIIKGESLEQNKAPVAADALPRVLLIKSMMKTLASYGPKLVVITDNTNGAYLYDGDHNYHIPMYPDPRPAFERTGCGDAWSATFISALLLGKTPLEALLWAPINPMSVAQFVGAQEGLLTVEQLEWWLHRAPENFRPSEI